MFKQTAQPDIHSKDPVIYRLNNPSEVLLLQQLADANPGIVVHDTMHSQLSDLMRCYHPKLRSSQVLEIDSFILEHLKGLPESSYGNWVFYPWANRLVHLLSEDEFAIVRTSRNNYKITEEERAALSRKKVGVVGLSVGQSVSITLAMERSFGELRIADFDVLELTNLNRIRTGVHTIGLPKVIAVAREIAEIDPYLKVVCFPEGLTDENAEYFFDYGGRLDAVIEECDNIYMKVRCREVAKAKNIPVIMDSSDRGMLDIERFDAEPERAIFHGLIEHLNKQELKNAKTNEEKVPFMLPIVGITTMSTRLKASLPEVEESISTWPQLATAVTLGGAIAADVYRRLMLQEDIASGRYFIDLESLIPAQKTDTHKSPCWTSSDFGQPLNKQDLINSSNALKRTKKGIALSREILSQLIRSASFAPSGGNCQPWKWLYTKDDSLLLFHDSFFSKSLLDFNSSGSLIAFGASLQNLQLEASNLLLEPFIEYFPSSDPALIACITFSKASPSFNTEYKKLGPYIELRHTNRFTGSKEEIPSIILNELSEMASSIPTASLQFLKSASELEGIADIIGAADRIRVLNKYGHFDMFERELRWTKKEVINTKDGIDLETLDMTASEKAGLYVAKDWQAIELLANWNLGKAFEKTSKRSVMASSAIGILSMAGNSSEDFISAGKALQKVWLLSTKHHLSFQPLAPAVFLFLRLFEGQGELLNKKEMAELEYLNKKFNEISTSPISGRKDLFLFRLNVEHKPATKSLRKSLDEILFWE